MELEQSILVMGEVVSNNNYHEEDVDISDGDMLTIICAWMDIAKGSVKVTKFIGSNAMEVLCISNGNRFKISVERTR